MKNFTTIVLTLTLLLFASYSSDAQPLYQFANSIGNAGWDEGHGTAVDPSGNVIITGFFQGTNDFDPGPGTSNLTSAGFVDGFVAKYNSNGGLIWARRFGIAGAANSGECVTVDAIGNIYVAGCAGAVFFAKYDPAGNAVYTRTVSPAGNCVANGIAVDAAGNAYITGYFQNTNDFDPGVGVFNLVPTGIWGEWDLFFAKYDQTGNLVWARSPGNGQSNERWGHDIAVDASGNVYITGYFEGTTDMDPGPGIAMISSTSGRAAFFGKYTNNGTYVWGHKVEGTGFVTGARAIALDAASNVYLTGYYSGTADFDPGPGIANRTSSGGSSIDMFFAKYDANGNYNWVNTVGGAASEDVGFDLVLDAAKNIYITGTFNGPVDFDPGVGVVTVAGTGGCDQFMAIYDNSGNFICAGGVGSEAANNGSNSGIAVDGAMNIYLTGWYSWTSDLNPGPAVNNLTSNGGSQDIFIGKYTACPIILPIQLVSFEAHCTEQNTMMLNWSVASEESIDHFIIERSANGTDFSEIGRVMEGGAKAKTSHYEFEDPASSEEFKYYRLKQVGKSGQVTSHGIITAENNCVRSSAPIMIFPNSVSEDLNLRLFSNKGETVQIEIYDLARKLIKSMSSDLSRGNNLITFDLASAASGMYLISIRSNSELGSTCHKFIKN